MKQKMMKFVLVVGAFGLWVGNLWAQETSELEQLKQEMREMRKQMQQLEQKIETLEQKPPAAAPPGVNVVAKPATEPALAPVAKSWSPTDPIRLERGGTYADLALVGTFAVGGSTASDIAGGTELGGHDPNQRGFTVQGAELNLQGAVDPYFRGNANVAFLLDSSGETQVELEEAWLETMSLPWNLQIRAGQYLTDFGRINTQHPHSWAFVDVPIVSGRLLGEDGLRNPGARLSWLAPTPFYSELFFGVQNSQGGTAYSFRDDHGGTAFFGRVNGEGSVENLGDLLYSIRYAASFDLTANQTLLAGLSGALGPNSSGANTDTQIYGVDVYWKWKSPHAHGGFPFVSWQTEAMVRRYEAGAYVGSDGPVAPSVDGYPGPAPIPPLPAEMVTDWGMYSQVLWGFKPGWVAGLRGDFAAPTATAVYETILGPDPARAKRWRISPNLTWYPSEFSKLRLQYNCDDRDGIGVDHSVWFQFEFLLGAHAAHKF